MLAQDEAEEWKRKYEEMKAEKERLEHQVTVQQQVTTQLRYREEKNEREIAAIAEKLACMQLLFGAEIEGVKKEVRQEVKQSEKRLREEFSLKVSAPTAHKLIDSKDWYWGNGCSSSSTSYSPTHRPEQSPSFKPMEDTTSNSPRGSDPRLVVPAPCSLFDWPAPQPGQHSLLLQCDQQAPPHDPHFPHEHGALGPVGGSRRGSGNRNSTSNSSTDKANHANKDTGKDTSNSSNGSCHAGKAGEDFDESELLQLVARILQQHGSLPIGKMGSMLHRAANNHTLPAKLKVRYGGLKRFLQAHSDKFCLGTDHPYNPHVRLVAPAPIPTSNPSNTLPGRKQVHSRNNSGTIAPPSLPPPLQVQGCGAGKRRLSCNSSKMGEGSFLALECEFTPRHPSPSCPSSPPPAAPALLRCVVLNFSGVVLYDKHVEGMGAPLASDQIPLATLQREAGRILQGHYLVGHCLQEKLHALSVRHEKELWRDISLYPRLCPCGPKTLPDLLWERLGVFFQTQPNQGIEEARACLAVYKSVLREWEATELSKKRCHPANTQIPNHQLAHSPFPVN